MPQLTPNWYLWDGEAFWISTLDWTVKVRNVKRDPRATICIDSNVRRGDYVQVFGTADVVEGDVREGTLALIRKYEPTEEASLAHWESTQGGPRPAAGGAHPLAVALLSGTGTIREVGRW